MTRDTGIHLVHSISTLNLNNFMINLPLKVIFSGLSFS